MGSLSAGDLLDGRLVDREGSGNVFRGNWGGNHYRGVL